MNNLFHIIKVELYKIITSKALWIVLFLILLIQPCIAMINAKDIVKLGLDASPATHPDLIQAFPPKEYLGFYDVVPFGLLPVVVLGGVLGASEYHGHQLRTTLLYCSNRKKVFLAKGISCFTCFAGCSFVSIYSTIAVTHYYLGDIGLSPVTLIATTWLFIGYAVIEWTLLGMLAYFIALIWRNFIVSVIFLLPQIYGLAGYLAAKWGWGKLLPVAAGKLLTTTPTDPLIHAPIQGGVILGAWVAVFLCIALYSFTHRDVGGLH